MMPAPGFHSFQSLPRPQLAFIFPHAWHLTKLSPSGPFSCDIFPACLILVNMTQGRQPFKERERGQNAQARVHTWRRERERKTSVKEPPKWECALSSNSRAPHTLLMEKTRRVEPLNTLPKSQKGPGAILVGLKYSHSCQSFH